MIRMDWKSLREGQLSAKFDKCVVLEMFVFHWVPLYYLWGEIVWALGVQTKKSFDS